MSEQQNTFNKESIKTSLGLEDTKLNLLLQELSLEEFQEFSQEQFQLIDQYNYLVENDYKAVIEDEIGKTGINRQEVTQKIYQELELEKENDALKLKTKYTLKSIKAEIEESLERSVKLSELEIILELSNLTLEDEYTDTQKEAIDKGLIKYLNQKSNGSFSSSDDEALLTVIRTNSGKTVESLVDRVSIKTAETEDYLNEMVDRQIPQEIFLQLKNQQESGIIAQKIEIAREKIAQQKRLNGKPTTIEIALTTDEQKHLPPMKSASVEDSKENGEK